MRVNHGEGKENSGVTSEPLGSILFMELFSSSIESLQGDKRFQGLSEREFFTLFYVLKLF